MEEIYLWEENYNDKILDENLIGQGFESKVYKIDDNTVAKIFYNWNQTKRTGKRLKALSQINGLDEVITTPKALIYLDMHLIGYTMDYFGTSLDKIVLNKEISYDKRIEMLQKIKELLVKMQDKEIVHGDLQLKNILYDGENLRISDINNAAFGKFKRCFLNKLTLYLSDYYGYSKTIDIQSFNYWCNILLNNDYEKIKQYVYLGADSFKFIKNNDIKNNAFDQSVYEEQMDIINNPKNYKKKALEKSKFLIDYIK